MCPTAPLNRSLNHAVLCVTPVLALIVPIYSGVYQHPAVETGNAVYGITRNGRIISLSS